MKVNEDKHIEKFIDKVMKEIALEKPSIDFTSKVMSQVRATKKSAVIVYQPLISKYSWMIIFGSFLLLVVYLIKNGDTQSTSWIDSIDLSILSHNIFSKVKFSRIGFYAVLFLTLMFYIQIPLIKKQINKQYKV
ncbi:MAG TPA: hypothetical protein VFY09_05145 [Flavobacteriaceae bacterium]|nr:hypothetical protein [Flavobacteriaceae bacterium]